MQTKQVIAFKNRLRNYTFDLSRIVKLDEDIELCYHKLGGVKGIDPSKEPTHCQMDKDIEYKIRDDIEKYEALRKTYESNILYVDSVLELIEEETRQAIKDVYIYGKNMFKVASKLYISKSTLRDRMDYRIKLAIEKKEGII